LQNYIKTKTTSFFITKISLTQSVSISRLPPGRGKTEVQRFQVTLDHSWAMCHLVLLVIIYSWQVVFGLLQKWCDSDPGMVIKESLSLTVWESGGRQLWPQNLSCD